MFTLKGIFPPPPKDAKKNFIKENVKQLRNMQNNRIASNNSRPVTNKKARNPPKVPMSAVTESTDKSTKSVPNVFKSHTSINCNYNSAAKTSDASSIKKADMSEYLRRKRERDSRNAHANVSEYYRQPTDNITCHKDVGCQYAEPDTTHFFADGTKLRIIYPSKKVTDFLDKKVQEVADANKNDRNSSTAADMQTRFANVKKKEGSGTKIVQSRYMSNPNVNGNAGGSTNRSAFSLASPVKNDIQSEEKVNPLLAPPGYQKGVVPRYIMKQKAEGKIERTDSDFNDVDSQCPPGHIALPESERMETLKILKEKFKTFVNELNTMPVRTDTLRMRNRKMQLDKELAKLEEGIKVFSRQRVYVNIEV